MAGSHIQFQFPWGLETIEMVNNRGDKPVKEREENSGKSYQVNAFNLLKNNSVSQPLTIKMQKI